MRCARKGLRREEEKIGVLSIRNDFGRMCMAPSLTDRQVVNGRFSAIHRLLQDKPLPLGPNILVWKGNSASSLVCSSNPSDNYFPIPTAISPSQTDSTDYFVSMVASSFE